MMNNFLPTVSVIIPLYNAEKYFGVCLESLLIQTFTDFEVIVVDDCSTDSSVAIAESYVERFGGRLKIFTLTQNTGNPSIPRNEGLNFSRGEYIYFMDDDDLLVDTALEILYNFAQSYRADVVYMERGFHCGEEIFPETFTAAPWDKTLTPIDCPTLEPENIFERVEKFLQTGYGWAPWTKFLQRDFLITNRINFPQVTIAEDVFWTFKIICLAKNFLRVPVRLYVNRDNETSITQTKRSPEEIVSFWTNPLITGVELLDKFMSDLDFFKQNSNARLHVLNYFMNAKFSFMTDALKVLDVTEVYEIFLREFSKANSTQPALIAYLLTMNTLYRNEMMK